MSNIRGLFSDRKDRGRDSDDSHDEDDDGNSRYVGGIGDRGGGSGLAVRPNPGLSPEDAVFRLAEGAGSDDHARIRRTITMYRNGFVVDDGPYRRLDDPNNREFLESLAKGQTPRELAQDSEGGGDVTVGLVDKRQEDYVEPFRFFSGEGQSLRSPPSASGGATEGDDTVFDPAQLRAAGAPSETAGTATPVQVRLPDGRRQVVRVPLTATVRDLAAQVSAGTHDGAASRFRLVAGFPPRPLRGSDMIGDAGLKGAQVSLQPLA